MTAACTRSRQPSESTRRARRFTEPVTSATDRSAAVADFSGQCGTGSIHVNELCTSGSDATARLRDDLLEERRQEWQGRKGDKAREEEQTERFTSIVRASWLLALTSAQYCD